MIIIVAENWLFSALMHRLKLQLFLVSFGIKVLRSKKLHSQISTYARQERCRKVGRCVDVEDFAYWQFQHANLQLLPTTFDEEF